MTKQRRLNEVRFERLDGDWHTHLCAHEKLVSNPECPDGLAAHGSPDKAWRSLWNMIETYPIDAGRFSQSLPFREAIQLMLVHPAIPTGTIFRIAYNQEANYYLGERRLRNENGEHAVQAFAVHSDEGAVVLNHLVLTLQYQ